MNRLATAGRPEAKEEFDMPKPIKDDTEALQVAVQIIAAQGTILSAYRLGRTRTPEGAIDALNRDTPRLLAYLEGKQS